MKSIDMIGAPLTTMRHLVGGETGPRGDIIICTRGAFLTTMKHAVMGELDLRKGKGICLLFLPVDLGLPSPRFFDPLGRLGAGIREL